MHRPLSIGQEELARKAHPSQNSTKVPIVYEDLGQKC